MVSNRERKTQQERTENNLRAWPQAACGDHMSARVAGGYDGDSSTCEGREMLHGDEVPQLSTKEHAKEG